MNAETLQRLLNGVAAGTVSVEKAAARLKALPFTDLGFARIDHHRALRKGFPEVVFCQGKADSHAAAIIAKLAGTGQSVLATRASAALFARVKKQVKGASYNESARTITVRAADEKSCGGAVLIVTAGTSDIPVGEEAAVTAEMMGCTVRRLYDAGVSGIHRLFHSIHELQAADVVVAIAGMEGALPSVIGGLTDRPIIAVPTSVGYGAHFGGVTPLLSMLNSCASGVTVVNIDNGFGAGYSAAMICRLIAEKAARGKKKSSCDTRG
ncbi:MAG TPA: nickel pincer cofactor biosynthesis protein LarB [bacterium]|nr:nickel pincer cofactor biosynthesis protein LarB [bacterium]